MKIVNFRVDDELHALMKAVAASEYMSVSAYIRRHFNTRARDLGLVADPMAGVQTDTPTPTVSTTPELDDLRLPDGSFDNHRLVIRMRTHARRGVTRGQFSKDFGIGLDEMERACVEAAKAGHDGSIDEWHTRMRRDDLRRMQLEACYGNKKPVADDDLFA